MALAIIRHLEIKRFRGVRGLSWSPHPQLNVVVGAADGGKSTVLEAIALLFSPAPNYGLSEFDYHGRNLEVGFSIQAILSFSDISIMRDEGFPAPPMQGWLNDKLTDLPDEAGAEPVLVCRLTGTADQEPRYEVLGAGGEIRAPFSRAMRRRIGLARLGVADRGDRDIRLVQGGALDRYLQGQEVRQTVLQAVMKTPLHDQLDAGPKAALQTISEGFKTRNLPHPVRLGLVGTPGVSLAASVGLTVGDDDPTSLPLSAWGTGTRRLAALEISTLGVSAETIAVIDEPETGLDPRGHLHALSRLRRRRALPPLSTSTVHKAKGLEFRRVLVCPADAHQYPPGAYGARLFYVAMSRATHQLTIVTDSDAPLVHLGATSVAGE